MPDSRRFALLMPIQGGYGGGPDNGFGEPLEAPVWDGAEAAC